MTRKYLWLGLFAAAGLGAAGYWQMTRPPAAAPAAPAPPVIPVVAVTAQTQSVSDYLTGLGTVQAFNRVTVHVRVDGELQQIAFQEGQFVHAGDLLARIDPRPLQATLDQSRAKKAQDQAQLISAQKDLQRAKTLIEKNFQTQQVLDQAQAKVDQLIATIDADKAAIEFAETQLSFTTIASPLDGRSGMRLIDKGNIVHAGDPGGLVVITQVQPIAVIFSVPQDYLTAIVGAMKEAPLKVSAYSRDNTTKLGEGTLLLIDNQIDAATGTLRLKASFPNPDDSLWPGQFVNVRLELALRSNAVAVPAQVLQRGPNALYVYVIKEGDRVERRTVKAGPVRDGIAVIEDGIQVGDRVIVDGQFKVRPGARVAVTMMPDTGKAPAVRQAAEPAARQAAKPAARQGAEPAARQGAEPAAGRAAERVATP